jgi:diadenosine tetraphosphate (Ap4A) HIT family hydrolase
MSATFEEFQVKFRVDDLTIYKSQHWTWSLRPVHSTLGAGILSLNRFCTSLGQIDTDEGHDLAVITNVLEKALHKLFTPQKMNYVMLMMVDRHLHFHVLPRYSESKTFAGLEWLDSGWPKPPAMGDYEDRSHSSALIEIRDSLRRVV